MMPVPKIPGYELLAPLGGGPMTCVYSSRESSADTLCAVKLPRPTWADQATAVKLLQREARAGLTVRHPNLVPLRYAHVTTPPYFLVMDLLAGETLRRRLRRDYRLEVPTAVWIARQTADALSALHRAGFLHGDVKPDNIRLVDDGTARLIDLGFAHRLGENAAFLREGYVLGTANYLAPELCAFKSEANYSSDVFSLGVTLYEMLTGTLPYPIGSLGQTIRRHSCDPPIDIRRRGGALPKQLAALIERLLAHKPADRPLIAAVVQQLVAMEIDGMGRRLSA
jgi:serine/threonine protein kinase